ncbi:MAG: hypothetical protein QXF17_06755, partial [Ignisphaera sp.]
MGEVEERGREEEKSGGRGRRGRRGRRRWWRRMRPGMGEGGEEGGRGGGGVPHSSSSSSPPPAAAPPVELALLYSNKTNITVGERCTLITVWEGGVEPFTWILDMVDVVDKDRYEPIKIEELKRLSSISDRIVEVDF